MTNYEVVVIGGTPAGIMAAVAAARLGCRVALVEYHYHFGGMTASGLGKSDIENRKAIAGLFKEFISRVHQHYKSKYGAGSRNEQLCQDGYYYEPSVAERVFNEMLGAEKHIDRFPGHQLAEAVVESNNLVGIRIINRRNGIEVKLDAGAFIDATYEGDLYALSGAAYRLGREGRSDFNEDHAGRIFFDFQDQRMLEGSSGEADGQLPAYTYRLCLTDDPGNSYVLKSPPSGYSRDHYIKYFDDLRSGRLGGPKVMKKGQGFYPAHFDTILRVFSFTEIPNRKYDVNINPRPLGFPFPGLNKGYPEAAWDERERIARKHRELTLGLLFFIQNDPEIPEDQRLMASKYHLPLDEFADNGHFPWQLYVREARRLKGEYVLNENDLQSAQGHQRTTVFHDSIMAGEFPIDSFPVSGESASHHEVLEGYIGMMPVLPYQVPLRIMLPEIVNQLIVPVAASTTHVAYSTIRMEPLWMGLGQVAGTLAHLSVEMDVEPASVPVCTLQKLLLEHKQVLSYFQDLDMNDKAFEAVQFWSTKGFFSGYHAKLHEPIAAGELKGWIDIFIRETGLKKQIVIQNKDHSPVSIAEFQDLINALFTSYLSRQTSKSENRIENLEGYDWLSDRRNTNMPVQRREVCLALYHSYFIIADN